jgi:DNA-directed RNA polymerase beta subunit
MSSGQKASKDKSPKVAPKKEIPDKIEPLKEKKEQKKDVVKPLDSTDLVPEDLTVLLDSELETNGLTCAHLDSFDSFCSAGINQIVTKLFKVEKTIVNERTNTPEDNEIETIHYVVKFNRVEIERPTTMFYRSGKVNLLMPGLARRHNLNYSAPIKVDATITAKAFLKNSTEPRVRVEEVKDFRIASMPIMVRSRLCNTNGMTAEALKACEEDPRDPGGYFILKGQEWVVSMLETRLYNRPHIFRNIGHEKERTRLEFLSIPGDAYENST